MLSRPRLANFGAGTLSSRVESSIVNIVIVDRLGWRVGEDEKIGSFPIVGI